MHHTPCFPPWSLDLCRQYCLGVPDNQLLVIVVNWRGYVSMLLGAFSFAALLAADPNVRDSSGYTALDYATERGLHYCALLLSKNEGIDEPDG